MLFVKVRSSTCSIGRNVLQCRLHFVKLDGMQLLRGVQGIRLCGERAWETDITVAIGAQVKGFLLDLGWTSAIMAERHDHWLQHQVHLLYAG